MKMILAILEDSNTVIKTLHKAGYPMNFIDFAGSY